MFHLRKLKREVMVEAGLDEELEVEVVGEYFLLRMRYWFRIFM